MPIPPTLSRFCQRIWIARLGFALLLLIVSGSVSAQKTSVPDSSFADTTGGYKFMYLSTNCFECSPKGLVYYKKFAIISGIYKVKDFYSEGSGRSADHFREKYQQAGYFKDKTTQIWKSPQLFGSVAEVREYKSDLVAKLKGDGYIVVVFDEDLKPDNK